MVKKEKAVKKRKSPARKPKRAMISWEKSPADLVERFESVMNAFPDMDLRKVFSYPCAFVNGNMAVGLHGGSMFLRLSQEDASELLSVRGAAPFEPMKGRPMKNYVVVPESVCTRHEELHAWITKARAFASRLPPKTKLKGRQRS